MSVRGATTPLQVARGVRGRGISAPPHSSGMVGAMRALGASASYLTAPVGQMPLRKAISGRVVLVFPSL